MKGFILSVSWRAESFLFYLFSLLVATSSQCRLHGRFSKFLLNDWVDESLNEKLIGPANRSKIPWENRNASCRQCLTSLLQLLKRNLQFCFIRAVRQDIGNTSEALGIHQDLNLGKLDSEEGRGSINWPIPLLSQYKHIAYLPPVILQYFWELHGVFRQYWQEQQYMAFSLPFIFYLLKTYLKMTS